MSPEDIKAAYEQALTETIILRRYTGTGSGRPYFDAQVRGKSWGYEAHQLVGTIQQGDQRVLVLVDDLIAKGFALPITNFDKVIVAGRETSIKNPGQRNAPDGTVVAYELQVRG